jgi:lysophospholipase L1-like esterase
VNGNTGALTPWGAGRMYRISIVATTLTVLMLCGGAGGRAVDARVQGAPELSPVSPGGGHPTGLGVNRRTKDFYVLGLGDSVPFAFNFAQFLTDPSNPDVNFGNGFVDQVTNALRAEFPRSNVTRANFSCPGETTTSLINGPCAYNALAGFPLHDGYTGSQLGAAEAFLADHRGPGLVLLNIGSNDPPAFAPECNALPQPNPCLLETYPQVAPEIRASIRANVGAILARLHRAAPEALIYVWNTYGLDDTDPQTVTILKDVNRAIKEAVVRRHPKRTFRAKLLDATHVVKPSTLCALTFWCNTGFDSHLTEAGHEEFTRTILRALVHGRH